MIRSVQSLISDRLTAVLSFGLIFNLLIPVSAHANQSFVACIKSSGEIRLIISSKKCAKKEKRTQISVASELSTSLIGQTGPQGPIGETGPAGPKGDTGAKGDTGSQGPKGDTGATGSSGVKGASTLTGVGAPANSLGENGDTYIDKNNAMIYGPKTNGVWGYGISFAGPAGAQGPAGPAGAAGAAEGDSFLIRDQNSFPSTLFNTFETPTTVFTRSFEPGKYLFEFKLRYISSLPVPVALVCSFQDPPAIDNQDALLLFPSPDEEMLVSMFGEGAIFDSLLPLYFFRSGEVSFSRYLEVTASESVINVSCLLFPFLNNSDSSVFGDEQRYGVIAYGGEMKAIAITNLISVVVSTPFAPTSMASSASNGLTGFLSRLNR